MMVLFYPYITRFGYLRWIRNGDTIYNALHILQFRRFGDVFERPPSSLGYYLLETYPFSSSLSFVLLFFLRNTTTEMCVSAMEPFHSLDEQVENL